MKKDRSLSIAARVLEIEAQAIKTLVKRLDRNFSAAIELILNATGKVVVTGMGKSGIICQKIASTLASTGTPSFFLHPAEGMHGDLGMIMRNDVLLAVSNSGSTDELIRIIPSVKRLGLKMIAMTGKKNSPLAKYADVTLDVGVGEEACPLGLAPTASTTATLAMGDALAVALLERRGFKAEDFAALHPAGNLGRQLMKVKDLMHTGEALPCVAIGATMREAIMEMTAKRMGVTGVFKGNRLAGVITDGDLRRALETGADVVHKTVDEVMTKKPRVIFADALAGEALRVMEERAITVLFVEDEKRKTVGVIHMHDLVKAGVV
ncbi:MAG: KpsF/GutQ family sugar-phosphate isomerase [Deltaproteobacteria bacterium]|nr:KpsF/GutQ family sugar-phosphate isomerase [Deltaproteobacteria bacterium]